LQVGRRCGLYSCQGFDIYQMARRTGWIEGRVMSVLAEAHRRDLGSDARAEHLSPLVPHGVRAILDAPDNIARCRSELEFVCQAIMNVSIMRVPLPVKSANRHIQVTPPGHCDFWLIPTHVPDHWTMVAIHWRDRCIRFYDSLPERASAKSDESGVCKVVLRLLEIIAHVRRMDLATSSWEWHSETVSKLIHKYFIVNMNRQLRDINVKQMATTVAPLC
jgi:hypothetical protein